MKYYLLLVLSCILAQSVFAGLGGSFTDTLDEDTDNGIHPECHQIKTDAYIAHTDDGYKAAFVVKSPSVDVGYVDVHWALTKYTGETARSQDFHYRMNRVGRQKFENILPNRHVDEALSLGDGDFVRYYFRYWAVPHNDADQGFMCNTEVKWFGSVVNTHRDEL